MATETQQERVMENRDHPLKGKQTPGHIVRGTDPPNKCPIIGTNTGMMTAFIAHSALDGESDAEMGAANAALYAEAHNVANTSGMWPAEMASALQAYEIRERKLREALAHLEVRASCLVMSSGPGYRHQSGDNRPSIEADREEVSRSLQGARALLSGKEENN